MDTLFESNLGYVECDVCGSGYNGVTVFYDNWAPDATKPFRFVRNSRCYGNVDESGLSRDELVSRMEESKFLVATRYARRNWRVFMSDLQRGRLDKGVRQPETIQPTVAQPAEPEPEQSNWNLVPYEGVMAETPPTDYRCMDSCCNPDHPDNQRLSQATGQQVYIIPNNAGFDPARPSVSDLTVLNAAPQATWSWIAGESPF